MSTFKFPQIFTYIFSDLKLVIGDGGSTNKILKIVRKKVIKYKKLRKKK
jgi:hypothetical protein